MVARVLLRVSGAYLERPRSCPQSATAMRLMRHAKLTIDQCDETLNIWIKLLAPWRWEEKAPTGPAQYVHWNGMTGFKDTHKRCYVLHAADLGKYSYRC